MSTAPAFIQQLFDSNGRPLSGGKLSTFVGGSTNLPKELYSDKALTTQLPNPLIADGSGYLPQYFMTSGAYKFECETSDNVLLWTRDWIEASGSSTSGASEYKVKVDQFDTAEYLVDKVVSSDGIDVVLYTGTTRKLEIKSKGQSKVNAGDALGYLNQKFTDTSSIKWSEVANKMTANVEVSAISATIPGDRKTVVDVEDLDVPGYLVDKIAAGVGPVTVTVEQAGQHKQLHVNVFDVGKVSVSENDSYDYLSKKLIAGAGITITSASDLAGEKLIINSRTNFWGPITYVASDYTVVDGDAYIGVRGNFSSLTLPTASAQYEGRKVVIVGLGIGYGCTVVAATGSVVGGNTVVANYSKVEVICFNNGSSWVWVSV
jgi:hypothetical protein